MIDSDAVFNAEDRQTLAEAKEALEYESLVDKLTDMIGMPIAGMIRALPEPAERILHDAIRGALEKALDVAVSTLDEADVGARPRLLSHKLLTGLSGAAGGAFGFASVAAELPVSTTLILRSIADIARSEGEDLSDVRTRLACMEVFALGPGYGEHSDAESDSDRDEIGYFAVRAGLAKQVAEASKYLATGSARSLTAPPMVRLIETLGSRFGVVVTDKVAAQAVPILGAVGGALINTYFIGHYQDLARAHFAIRRLERRYGESSVREHYGAIDLG